MSSNIYNFIHESSLQLRTNLNLEHVRSVFANEILQTMMNDVKRRTIVKVVLHYLNIHRLTVAKYSRRTKRKHK